VPTKTSFDGVGEEWIVLPPWDNATAINYPPGLSGTSVALDSSISYSAGKIPFHILAVKAAIFYAPLRENCRGLYKFFDVTPGPTVHDSAPGFTLVCHSEEPCDEESAFSFLIEKTGRAQKQILHGVYPELCRRVQHDTTNSKRPGECGFSLRLCVFAGDILTLLVAAVIDMNVFDRNNGLIEAQDNKERLHR
jgi:hypothetical protein